MLEARPGQTLEDHLRGVASLGREIGEKFNSPLCCEVMGLLHDYGKSSSEWQEYLKTGIGQVSHSPQGAALAMQLFGKTGVLFAYGIKGHHSHLPDWHGDLDKFQNLNQDILLESLDPASLSSSFATLPTEIGKELGQLFSSKGKCDNGFIQLWIRMLSSSLVDADRLNAEAVNSPKATTMRGEYDSWDVLENKFKNTMDSKQKNAQKNKVNSIRHNILEEVRSKASGKPGFYTLNVPTGGGKTLTAMDFALKHRHANNMDRIIMAIPYNSIIEQTARIYKDIFGEENVLEHHSNFDPPDESRFRQAVENWDMPLVVTTNVQLFESLFSSRASDLRKIHNIVNSIIILDEAQMLPSDHLLPILAVLRILAEHFGCTIVLCSATIPALEGTIPRSDSTEVAGLPEAMKLIDEPDAIARDLKRTRIRHIGKTTLEDIACKLESEGQALCIVNTKRSCRQLYDLVNLPDKIHLSGAMCPAERQVLLSMVREKLKNNENIVIVATQLIEAGVDIDVKTVFRELTGIDSIAQAAGRCNREGLHECGEVFTFDLGKNQPYSLKIGYNIASELLPDSLEWDMTPELYKKYFIRYYNACRDIDKASFKTRFNDAPNYQYDSFSKDFKMIDNEYQSPLVVLYGNAANVIEALREAVHPTRTLFRKLQPYTVNVSKKILEEWRRGNLIESIGGIDIQLSQGLYEPGTGLNIPSDGGLYNY